MQGALASSAAGMTETDAAKRAVAIADCVLVIYWAGMSEAETLNKLRGKSAE